ncbi:MAG: ABC transporter ATP-binding protein [Trueperaceae bacterium]
MALVRFENVEKAFGSVKAVDDVSFDIADGEFVCLLGPSGCGKTTTLRLIAGLEKPTAGTIHIGDRDVTKLAARDRDIGMVFQDYALYPHMSIADNIGYPLKGRGAPVAARDQRVREVADHLQIGNLLERRPGQISGGQQQRTSVARAVVHEPQVFLFDEPLSNLDAKLRLEARSFLKHLQREVGVTAVYVTHDQAEAMAIADRIAVMSDGKIVQIGPPLEVYRRPATTFVANFLGSPPMNLLPFTVHGSPRPRLTSDEVELALSDATAAWLVPAIGDGRTVTAGIRPEHLKLVEQAGPATISGAPYAVETLGPESLVTLKVGETLLTVRVFSDDPPDMPEGVAHVLLDEAHVHYFDADGVRIEAR